MRCRISERLGDTVPLPTRMKSHHRPYQEYYDEETRRMASEIYAHDIAIRLPILMGPMKGSALMDSG